MTSGQAISLTTATINRPSTQRLVTASLIGTTLEWYDFTIYNTLAALIFNRLFFPSFDPLAGTVLAFSTYAVGYVSRPVGGIIFGYLGDRLGRRSVLVTTLLCMGLISFLMGILPTYASIGAWSGILLVTLRFIQGAALGGEWAGAVLIAVEHGDQKKRGLSASWTQCGPALGILLGTGFLLLITYASSPEQFVAWVWRIPFLLSVVLVGFGLWVRRGIEETPVFRNLEERGSKAKAPIGEVVQFHWRRMLLAAGVRIGSDVVYTLALVFPLTYVTTVLNRSRTLALSAIMIATMCNAVAIPLCGALSDRVGRRPVYATGAILSLPWAFAFFSMVNTGSRFLIISAAVLGALFHASMYGPQGALIVEQFPSRVRYAGASVSYNMAGIVGAGVAPLVFVSLFQAYRTTTAVSLYVVASLCITLTALWFARETARSPMED